jgi:hypothetical protein
MTAASATLFGQFPSEPGLTLPERVSRPAHALG